MLNALVIQAERLDSNNARDRARAVREIMDYDMKTSTSHENQKLINRLHNLIYNVEVEGQDEHTVNAEVDQYLTSQERP